MRRQTVVMHEEKIDGLEKKLKQEAAGWSVQPSAELWSRVESQLPRRRRRRVFWWAAAAVLLLGGAYLWYQRPVAPAPASLAGSPAATTERRVPPSRPPAAMEDRSPSYQQHPAASPASPVYPSSRTNGSGIRVTERVGGARQAPTVPAPSPAQEAASPAEMTQVAAASSLSARPLLSPLGGSLTLKTGPLHPGPAMVVAGAPPFLRLPAAGFPEAAASATLPAHAAVRLRWEAYVTPAIDYRHWRHQTPSPSGASSDYAAAPSNYNQEASTAPSDTPRLSHQPTAGWSAGFQASWSMGPRLSLLGGLRFSSMGYQIKAYRSFQAYVQGNRGPAFAPASSANSQFTALARAAPPADQAPRILHNRYYYAEVPLLLRMEYGKGPGLRFFSSAGAGLSLMWDGHANIYAPESGRYFTDPDKLRTLNADLFLNAGVTAPLGRTLRLQLGPSFQYKLFSNYRDYPQVREYPWQLGLRLGLQWPR